MNLTIIPMIFAAFTIVSTITACGGSGNSTPTPIPTPTPTPTPTVDFPVQLDPPSHYTHGDSGSILVSELGLSLYFFANDEVGISNCLGSDGDPDYSTSRPDSCAGKWPPLMASDGAVETLDFSLVQRDGAMQWAFKGSPLYTFSEDNSQGDINGDGIDGLWDLARPAPVKAAALNDINTFMGNLTVLTGTLVGEQFENRRANLDGFTLYTFDHDPINESACQSQGCLDNWPPLLADNAAKPSGMLSVINITGDNKQWAYKGKALYFFNGDAAAGQTNGDNVGDVWHTANQLPAIQRSNEAGTQLTATGLVSVLLPNPENNAELLPSTVDKDQFTLYIFDNDENNISNCKDNCIVNWPAYLVSDTEQPIGDFSQIVRDDGNKQWALAQQPLYFYAGDSAKAQTNGNGIGGVWHIIEPTPPTPTVTTQIIANETSLGNSLTTSGQVIILADDGNGTFVPSVQEKSGFQLYIFDNDETLRSNCNSSGCMSTWPALLASETDQAVPPFSLFTRNDGHQQWAINGQPLYFYDGDTLAAEQKGEAVGNVWWVARPSPIRVYDLGSKGEALIAHGNVLPSQGKTSAQLMDLTLYTFDEDQVNSGLSTCFGGCATTWPPLYANAADQAFGEYSVISRTESDNSQTLQWSYKGLPLYFYTSDSQLGDTTGDYPSWTIARP